jgi:hypothetical protein
MAFDTRLRLEGIQKWESPGKRTGASHNMELVLLSLAGRSQLRLAMLELPTHREVMAAAVGCPLWVPPGSRAFELRVCVHAAASLFLRLSQ